MKIVALICGGVLASCCAFAQKKSLGIGTTNPNPNAVLHAESPENNQGILIPRLTNAQRTSLQLALSSQDVGLIVFDTDSRALAIWNGTGWDIGSKVGAPIAIDNAASTGNAANLLNSNASNTDPALTVNTNGMGNAIQTSGKIQAGQFMGDGSGITGITAAGLTAGSVNSAILADNEITDADINPAAAIAGTKIDPNFGTQSIITTGTIVGSDLTASGNINVKGINYNWPLTSNGGVLTNDGTGTLTWSAVSGTGDLISSNNLSDILDPAAARTNLELGPLAELNNVGSAEISDNSITDADINSAALISGAKINPDFSDKPITTTGSVTAASFFGDGSGLTNITPNINSITASHIADGTIENKDISGTAGIEGFKVIPNFGAQNISTAGTVTATSFIGDGSGLTGLSVLPLPYSNTVSGSGILFSITNSGTGFAAIFENSNGANGSTTLATGTNGTGSAASFSINNVGSSAPVLDISTNGTGPAISASGSIVASSFFGNGSGLTGITVADGSVTGGTAGAGVKIAAATITDANINGGAAIAGTKINPAFGSQNIATTGTVTATSFTGDGSGLTNLPSTGWSLTGNGTTNPSTDFIGTTDAQDLIFKTNNTEALRLYANGQIGIGATPIAARVDIGTTANSIGLHAGIGTASASQNRGIQADASGSTAQNIGVYSTGYIDGSNGAIGVYGEAIGNGSSDAFGLYGVTNNFTTTTGTAYGVYASAEGGSVNWAGYFEKGNVHIQNALSVGLTNGTYGAVGEVLTSQGSGAAPIWAPAAGLTLPYTGSSGTAANTLELTNTSSGHTIRAVTSGTGAAGFFENTNPGNNMRTVVGITNSLSGGAGGFQINNSGNSNTALTADTNGSGLAFGATTTGTSTAGQFDISNSTNSAPALKAQTNGDGNGLLVAVSKVGNTQPAISITHAGTGNAITANRPIQASQFIGDGSLLTNLPGGFTLPYVNSSSSGSNLFDLTSTGTGVVGNFVVNNTGNTNPAIWAETNGDGGAIVARATGTSQALVVQQLGASSNAIDVTNSGSGAALGLFQSNNGIALEFQGGGLRYNVTTASVNGTLFARTVIYHITGGNSYTLGWSPLNGEAIYVLNTSGAQVNFAGATINAGTLARMIYVAGSWHVNQ